MHNLVLDGNGLTVVANGAVENFIDIHGDDIALMNFRLMPTQSGDRFNVGLYIYSDASNVTVDNVNINNGTNLAAVRIHGQNTCVRGVTAMGAGTGSGNTANGYTVDEAASGTLDFRGAVAKDNTSDGFAIGHSSGPPMIDRVQFLNSMSTLNGADGFDLAGPLVELLCSQAIDNGQFPGNTPTPGGPPTPTPNAGRGVVMFGIPTPTGSPVVLSSTLQVENCSINGNWRLAVSAGATNQTTANILNSTLYQNNRKGPQVSNGKTVNIFNAVVVGTSFVKDTGQSHCGHNLYNVSQDKCTGAGDVTRAVKFADSSHTTLKGDSPGVNQGVDLAVPAATFGFPVRVARAQDANGVPRPVGAGYDMGAYEAATPTATPQLTSTSTATGTVTNTRTRTPTPVFTFTVTSTPTITRTPTNTRTPTPYPTCTTSCVGDCNCDGSVSINELIAAVNIALGSLPVEACMPIDKNVDGMISIDELITAVNDALNGCSMASLAASAKLGTVALKIGSAAGAPGDKIEFTIDVLDGASQPAGASIDLTIPIFNGFQQVISAPQCVISPRLGAQGLQLTTSDPILLVRRLIVSQASQDAGTMGAMQCPGPTMPDGAVANCTAYISSDANPGHVYSLHGGVAGDSYVNPASVSDAFGDAFNTMVVDGAIVVNGTSAPNSSFVSQSVPTTMTAGQEYSVSVTMKNTGTMVWTADPLLQYWLGAVNPQGNTTWGMDRVALDPGDAVAYNGQKTFTWTVTAPSSAGTYNFQWQMLQDGDTQTLFGATSTNVAVSVVCGGCGCP